MLTISSMYHVGTLTFDIIPDFSTITIDAVAGVGTHNGLKTNTLRFESLETRTLLSATDWCSINEYSADAFAVSESDAIEPEILNNIVDTVDDIVSATDGKTSLREAIANAQDGDTITFASSLKGQTITLAGTELTVAKGITIDASSLWDSTNNKPGITINANQQSRVFNISDGTSTEIEVSLKGLTITGGKTSDYGDNGGGIYCDGENLTIVNSTISGNSATGSNSDGGGIYNSGTLTITNCTISGNSASYSGGGISNSGALTITNCTISGNSASFGGGGIVNYDGTSTLYNTIITGNYAQEGHNDYSGALSSQSSNNIIGYDAGFVVAPTFDSNGLLTNASSMNLRLSSGSQAIDAGNNSFISLTTDAAGNSRKIKSWKTTATVDIGAYEYQGTISRSQETVSTVVTTEQDIVNISDGKISLREAIQYASEGSTITFASSLSGKTITLNGCQLFINKGLTIDASALTAGITISGNNKSNIFSISGGSSTNSVVLKNLNITNGKSSSGGGISNSGALTITNCTISGNSASFSGGGISNSGALTITNSTISGNSAFFGGGIVNNTGTLTITNTTISGNSADMSGGGVTFFDGTLTITNSTISGNSATNSSSSGGGIDDYSGTLTIINSTVSDNSAFFGGGIVNEGTLTITNCTISENSAFFGGGIVNNTGTLTITNCTISGNSATSSNSYGGGIYNYPDTLTLYNTIIVGNTATDGADIYKQDGTTINGYNNLSSYTDWEGSSNLAYDSTKPLFVDSANGNYRLADNSQAINKGNNTYATNAGLTSSSKDLAGNARFSDTIDIGAYEYAAQLLVPTLYSPTANGTTVTVSWSTVTNRSSYTLEYKLSSSSAWTAKTGLTATSTTFTGVAGSTYNVRVKAVGSGSYTDSDYSSTLSVTVPNSTTQLSAPTISATASGTTSISVILGTVTNASSYTIEYSTSSSFTSKQTKTAVSGSNSITGLTAGSTYYFRALAVGTGNYSNSGYSSVVNATTSSLTYDLQSSNGGTLSPNPVTQGNSFTLSNVPISNIGTGASGSYTIKYYASTDTTINTSDTLLGTYTMSSLAAGASTTDSRSLSTSNLTAGSSYYIGWIISGVSGETATSNNIGRTTSTVNIVQAAVDNMHTVTGNLTKSTYSSGETITLTVDYSFTGTPTSFGLNVDYDTNLLEYNAAASSSYETGLVSGSFPGTVSGRVTGAWNDANGWAFPSDGAPLMTLVFTVKTVTEDASGAFTFTPIDTYMGDDDTFTEDSVDFSVKAEVVPVIIWDISTSNDSLFTLNTDGTNVYLSGDTDVLYSGLLTEMNQVQINGDKDKVENILISNDAMMALDNIYINGSNGDITAFRDIVTIEGTENAQVFSIGDAANEMEQLSGQNDLGAIYGSGTVSLENGAKLAFAGIKNINIESIANDLFKINGLTANLNINRFDATTNDATLDFSNVDVTSNDPGVVLNLGSSNHQAVLIGQSGSLRIRGGNIQNVLLSQGADTITGSKSGNTITDNYNSQNVVILKGGENTVDLHGNSTVVVKSETGTNNITITNGDHSLVNLIRSQADNTVIVSGNNSTVQGGKGNDNITASGDYIIISATQGGNDTINVIGNNFSVSTGAGDDDITVIGSNGNVSAGAGNDTIRVKDHENGTVSTGNLISGGEGNDFIYAALSNGANIFYANSGNDFIIGGHGNDTIYGNSGNNLLAGGEGKDQINGGTGRDILIGSLTANLANLDETALRGIYNDLLDGWMTDESADVLGILGQTSLRDNKADTLKGGNDSAIDIFFANSLDKDIEDALENDLVFKN